MRTTNSSVKSRWNGLEYSSLVELLFVLLAIAILTLVAINHIERKIKEQTRDSLQVVLENTHNAFSIWAKHQLQAADQIATITDVWEDAESLVFLSNDRNNLLSSPELNYMRNDLQLVIQSGNFTDYLIVGPGNINLASSSNEPIGNPNILLQQPDILEKLWSGMAMLSRPLKSAIPLKMENGMLMTGHPTMFAGAPIRNYEGHVIALLLLRIDPFNTFFKISQQGRLGQTGESYVFDQNGTLLTESRFHGLLEKVGLLEKGMHSSLWIQIRDPGINLLETKKEFIPGTEYPLTRMAASAVKGESRHDVDGYRDYRGVPVVGAWLWDNNFNMGFVVEQNVSEAYSTFILMKRITYGGAAFSMLVLIAMRSVSEKGKIRLQSARNKLDAIINSSVIGIVVIDEKGIIESVNPAVSSILGYAQEELIGRNVSILMPDPDRTLHDNYLHNYIETNEKKIIGIGREVVACHKDGQLIPVELSISEMQVEGERRFAGMIHDISERVTVEDKLKRVNDELRLMALVAQKTAYAVSVTDRDGGIEWVNDAFIDMNGYAFAELGGHRPRDILQGPETDPNVVSQINKAMEDGIHIEADILNYRKSGNAYWAHVEVTPIIDEQGEIDEFVVIEQDITKQRQLLNELQWSKATAENAVEDYAKSERIVLLSLAAAGAGYWHIDFSTGALQLDKRSLEILGLPGEDFTGRYQDWANWVHPDDLPDAQGEFIDALDDSRIQAFDLDYRIVRPNSEVRFVNVSANIERDRSGMPISAYGLYFDETERKHTEGVLRQAIEEAESANRAKSSFLAAMSHEIRTPMNGVVGMIDVLCQTPLNEEQKDVAQTIRDSSFSLLGIIDDILDFSKIEAGRLSLERLPTSIEQIVESVGDTLLPIANKKGIELLIFCSPVIPPTIYTDPTRLRQILFNLGGNAIKFTDSDSEGMGRVLICAELDTMADDRVYLLLKVEDNGIGMSPDVQEQLFQPFAQGESSTTRRFGGTGLGLTISRRLSDLMGGRIEMESEQGEGSVFSVFIPLEIASIEAPEEIVNLEGVSVLQFNSEETLDLILDTYLTVAGANVARMNADDNAVEVVKNLSPKSGELVVILDDHTNPGQAQSRRQRLSQELAEFKPIFIELGHGMRQSPRKEGNRVAMDIDAMHRSTFLRAVEASLGRISLETKSVTGGIIEIQTPVSVDEAKAAGTLILIAEDNQTNQKVLLQQLGMLGYAAEVANDGREALSMWRDGNYALLLTDCHMPEMDGYELTQAIREEEGDERHIPIIAITADALKDASQRCLSSGMDDYLSKPVQLDFLRDKLTQWVESDVAESQSDTDSVIVAVEDSVDTAETTEVVDPEALKEILGSDDPAMLADFYSDFIRTSEETIEVLLVAYKTHEAEEIGAMGHRLKSSARTVGANTLADCCLALELAGKDEDWDSINTQINLLPAYFQSAKDWVKEHYG